MVPSSATSNHQQHDHCRSYIRFINLFFCILHIQLSKVKCKLAAIISLEKIGENSSVWLSQEVITRHNVNVANVMLICL